jgi:Cu(I)/Ag(I) efflux system membrane fusion protein
VPEKAILYAGDRQYVFLDLGEGRLRPRAVTLGQRAGEWTEVLEGLEPGDLVVTSGNFLIAAEARLSVSLDHWSEPSE